MLINTKGSLVASILAAIGASACCIGPLVLLALGIGGAWVGRLTALTPYSPIFTALTLVFLGLAFRQLYLGPRTCVPGAVCADERVVKRQRLLFWLVAVLLVVLLAFPLFAPLFY